MHRRGWIKTCLGGLAALALPKPPVAPRPKLISFYAYEEIGVALAHTGPTTLTIPFENIPNRAIFGPVHRISFTGDPHAQETSETLRQVRRVDGDAEAGNV